MVTMCLPRLWATRLGWCPLIWQSTWFRSQSISYGQKNGITLLSRTKCQHKHYLLEYFLKKISTHQKMLKITTFMFYFAGIIHSFKIKPTFWGGNYFVKLNLVCNSLKSHKFNHNFVTSTFKSNFEASYIIFYGS